jgi:hypothetical protein
MNQMTRFSVTDSAPEELPNLAVTRPVFMWIWYQAFCVAANDSPH